MALPTNGRVVLDTTLGEIDIELWSKETPKTCRNFLALAMEGYYDNVIFHRVVKNFLVQTGDKTGTGAGGESFYGEPFEDEIHPRLRYAHRGLVGMANNGSKHSNDSQFFITLDRADELHGKHTLFGRCVGDTFYNVLKIGEMELDKDGRPVYPPKIKTVRILENPFGDIVPRITAAEKRAQARAKERVKREREESARVGVKNAKLLSFDDEEGQIDAVDEGTKKKRKKAMARPDLLDADAPLPSISTSLPPAPPIPSTTDQPNPNKDSELKMKKSSFPPGKQPVIQDLKSIREKHEAGQTAETEMRKAEIERMEAEIRALSRRARGGAAADSDSEGGADDEPGRARRTDGNAKSKSKSKPKSALGEEMGRYEALRGLRAKKRLKGGASAGAGEGGKARRDEGDVLAALDSFRGKLQRGDEPGEPEVENAGEGGDVEDTLEIDDDTAFLTHALRFPADDGAESGKAEREYEVIDPRERGAKAKEEERERKLAMKAKAGRRRW